MQTRVCKLCFKVIKDNSINAVLGKKYSLCPQCYKKLEPKFIKFKTDGVDCLSIYEYNEDLKGLIYQFKGCFDYELKDIFLDRFKSVLKLRFYDYLAVPVPSWKDDDLVREFNHVEEAFKGLKLEIVKLIEKTEKVKQSDRHENERSDIGRFLRIVKNNSLKGKKILLVDDIYTTGSTIKACISLLKSLNPKKIKVLVLCKVQHNEHIVKTNNNNLY